MKHFVSLKDLTSQDMMSIIRTAENYQQNGCNSINKQIFAANLFFEPSTRTKMSFTVAQKKLGFEILDFHKDSSSMQKGESLYDTAQTFAAIGANLLVIRHEADDWYEELASLSVPVINAGAGKAEHPTQCMLDLLTIYQEFNRFTDLNIVICGDIRHSRVAHSNANALHKLGANVFLSAAPGFEDETLPYLYISIDEAVEICDVLMLLRIQHERHEESKTMEQYLDIYGLTTYRENKMKDKAIILHPAPVNRGVEIASELVECERSRIFKQMTNGVYVRMAIITKLLQEWGMLYEDSFEKC